MFITYNKQKCKKAYLKPQIFNSSILLNNNILYLLTRKNIKIIIYSLKMGLKSKIRWIKLK